MTPLTDHAGAGHTAASVPTTRLPVGTTLVATALLLAGCSPAATSDEVDTEPAAAATEQDEVAQQGEAEATEAGSTTDGPTGTATCTDPTDDAITVDEEAFAAYEGSAYAADTVELELTLTEESLDLRTQENPDKLDRPPAGPLRFDIWFATADGSETALLRATSPGPGEINVETGPDEASLAPVDTTMPRITGAGAFMTSIDRELLPALEGPFHFAYMETFEGNGTADVCPNGVSVDDPFADVEAMTAFTE